MGQIAVASDSGTLRTLVGSCVSVALFDPRLHLAGLAMFFSLSHTVQLKNPAGSQIRRLLNFFVSSINYQEASSLIGEQILLGGAAMFPGHEEVTVGTQNITAVETLLRKNRIPIVAKPVAASKAAGYQSMWQLAL